MAKIRIPFFSFAARGRVGKLFTVRRLGGLNIIEKIPKPTDALSSSQLSWRTMFNLCVDLWHTLSEAERQTWESAARPLHMTGYAWYISQCLRPNPGIYLPLAGGTMSGDIDMDANRLLKLPVPVAVEEPTRLAELISHIAAVAGIHGLGIGARVYQTAGQAIPHNTSTPLAYAAEEYDTDSIHDNITNNTRLTCKTSGTYLIGGTVRLAANAVGRRAARIRLNAATWLEYNEVATCLTSSHKCGVITTAPLSVGDYVELAAYQTSGAALNTGPEGRTQAFFIHRVG